MNSNDTLQTEPPANRLNSFPERQAGPDVPPQPRIVPRGLEILHILNGVFDNEAFASSGLVPVTKKLA